MTSAMTRVDVTGWPHGIQQRGRTDMEGTTRDYVDEGKTEIVGTEIDNRQFSGRSHDLPQCPPHDLSQSHCQDHLLDFPQDPFDNKTGRWQLRRLVPGSCIKVRAEDIQSASGKDAQIARKDEQLEERNQEIMRNLKVAAAATRHTEHATRDTRHTTRPTPHATSGKLRACVGYQGRVAMGWQASSNFLTPVA